MYLMCGVNNVYNEYDNVINSMSYVAILNDNVIIIINNNNKCQ